MAGKIVWGSRAWFVYAVSAFFSKTSKISESGLKSLTMKFTYKYRRPRLDLAGYKEALDKHMSELLEQGLMAWLEAVITEVPVWSGASRATFIKVAKTIGFSVPVSGGPAPFDRTSIGQAASTGELEVDVEKGLYVFTYGTSLPWLIWNEHHNANLDPDPTLFAKLTRPGPYEFQLKGMAAFLHATGSIGLPRVAPFIQSVTVR